MREAGGKGTDLSLPGEALKLRVEDLRVNKKTMTMRCSKRVVIVGLRGRMGFLESIARGKGRRPQTGKRAGTSSCAFFLCIGVGEKTGLGRDLDA